MTAKSAKERAERVEAIVKSVDGRSADAAFWRRQAEYWRKVEKSLTERSQGEKISI